MDSGLFHPHKAPYPAPDVVSDSVSVLILHGFSCLLLPTAAPAAAAVAATAAPATAIYPGNSDNHTFGLLYT